MEIALSLVAVVLLAVAVLELHSIRQELSRLQIDIRKAETPKDSPTINVNVGALPVQPQKEAPEEEGDSARKEKAAGGEGETREENPEVLHPIPVNVTPSGLAVLKCPACQAENSGFRSECFNCGARLR
jgi:hypothetical protein